MGNKTLAASAIFLLDGALASLKHATAATTLEESKKHMAAVNEAVAAVVECAHNAMLEHNTEPPTQPH